MCFTSTFTVKDISLVLIVDKRMVSVCERYSNSLQLLVICNLGFENLGFSNEKSRQRSPNRGFSSCYSVNQMEQNTLAASGGNEGRYSYLEAKKGSERNER